MTKAFTIKTLFSSGFLFFSIITFGWSQSSPPRIEIDSEGHSGKIYNLSYTPDGSKVISISEDKSIRVWNTENGELITKFQSEISDGYGGMFYSSSISPDGKLLAVAGYPTANQEKNYILLIDIASNKQVATAVGHTNVINSLDFSSNGQYLASGGDDGTVLIWDLQNIAVRPKLLTVAMITVGAPITSLFFNQESRQLIAGADNGIFLYDISSLNNGGLNFPEKKLSKYKGEVNKVICSPNGKYIAASTFSGELIVWQSNGSFIKAIEEQETVVNAMAFSYDSHILVAMDIAGKGTSYSLPNFTKLAGFSEHDNTVFAAAFSPKSLEGDYTVATAGGNNHEIYFWNAISGKSKLKIKSKGNTVWGLAFNEGLNLKISNKQADGNSLTHNFDLSTFQLRTNSESDGQANPQPTKLSQTDLYSLAVSRGGTISNDPVIDGRILTFTSTNTGEVVVGSDLSLKLYDREGTLKKVFNGHTGSVRSVSVSADGRYLASGSEDQSVIIWKLDEAGKVPSMRATFMDPLWQEYFESLPLDSLTNMEERSAWLQVIEYLKKDNDKTWKDISAVYQELGATAKPFLHLFISEDNEWVCWTPKGYFTCSSDGPQYFGWHVGRGINELADFYTAEQYFDILYRPESLGKSVAQGKRVEEILQADGDEIFDLQKLNRPSAIFFKMDKELQENKTLTFRGAGGGYTSENQTVPLGVTYFDGGGGIKEILVYQNEKLIILDDDVESISIKSKETKTYTVNLSPGLNNFTVVVKNFQNIESREENIKLYYKGEVTASSNLYMISVGINKYKNTQYNLNYAQADAESFSTTVENNAGSLFKSIKHVALYDYEATRENLVKAFKLYSEQAGPEDVFIFYYAGHGTIDEDSDNEYYLVPTDVTKLYGDSRQLIEKGVSATDLKHLLSDVKAQKQLILMDACHSGGAVSKIKVRAAASEEKALVQLARASGVVMIASSGTKQFSAEFEELGHGVFTYALLEALGGKGDGGDNKVTVNELKIYMEERVPFLSDKYGGAAQYPTGFVHGNDFPIGLVK